MTPEQYVEQFEDLLLQTAGNQTARLARLAVLINRAVHGKGIDQQKKFWDTVERLQADYEML